MDINLYIKSHVFNSSVAAEKLARKDAKHLPFAEKLITKKINKITNSPTALNVDKLDKYNNLLNNLSFVYRNPENYLRNDVASSAVKNQIIRTSNIKEKFDNSLTELASVLEKKRIVPDSPEVRTMNDPAHIKLIKEKT